jgi:hypothetical protein
MPVGLSRDWADHAALPMIRVAPTGYKEAATLLAILYTVPSPSSEQTRQQQRADKACRQRIELKVAAYLLGHVLDLGRPIPVGFASI